MERKKVFTLLYRGGRGRRVVEPERIRKLD